MISHVHFNFVSFPFPKNPFFCFISLINFSSLFFSLNTDFIGFVDCKDFDAYAELIIENGTISLIHEQHKFIRDRVENDRSYWRCRDSFRFNCKSRVVTRQINGIEMMKIRNGVHDHSVAKKRKMKSKRVKPNAVNKTAPSSITRKMPELTPMTVPKVREVPNEENAQEIEHDSKTNNNPTYEDNEIIDILD